MVTQKKSAIRLVIMMGVLLLLTGCSLMSNKNNSAACSTVSAAVSAEAYYDEMLKCAQTRNYTEAALLYALGGTTTWYDAQQHPGEASTHRHKTLLSNVLNQLQPDEKTELWKAVNAWMKNPADLRLLCSRVESRAPGSASNMQWKSAMASYMHCPLIVDASTL